MIAPNISLDTPARRRCSLFAPFYPLRFSKPSRLARFSAHEKIHRLMGIIAAEGKQTRPFLIGEALEYTPKEDGMLLLRINAPPGNKSSGKIRVSISGNVELAK